MSAKIKRCSISHSKEMSLALKQNRFYAQTTPQTDLHMAQSLQTNPGPTVFSSSWGVLGVDVRMHGDDVLVHTVDVQRHREVLVSFIGITNKT